MKKFSKGIALALVRVMLACSFSSCLSYVGRSEPMLNRVLYAVVDIVFLPISLIALIVYLIVTDASGEMGYDAYLASAGDGISGDYLFLLEKFNSLPEGGLASLKRVLDTIPEAERGQLMEKVRSLTEAERAALVGSYASLPDAEIISSMQRVEALPLGGRVGLLQDFVALSEEGLASIIEELKAMRDDSSLVAAALN
jgi:hypothetical protein